MIRIIESIFLFLTGIQFNWIGIANASRRTSSSYEEKCKEWGFDPSQLACETCNLLLNTKEDIKEERATDDVDDLSIFFDECKICCQSWRKNLNPEMAGNFKSSSFDSATIELNELGVQDAMMQGIPPELAAQLGISMPMGGTGSGGTKTEAHDFIESGDFGRLLERKGKDSIRSNNNPDVDLPSVILYNKNNADTSSRRTIDVSDWKQDDIRDLLMFAVKDEGDQ